MDSDSTVFGEGMMISFTSLLTFHELVRFISFSLLFFVICFLLLYFLLLSLFRFI